MATIEETTPNTTPAESGLVVPESGFQRTPDFRIFKTERTPSSDLKGFINESEQPNTKQSNSGSEVTKWLSGSNVSDKLGFAAEVGSSIPSDRAGRILKASEQTGLPEDLVDRNLENIEHKSRVAEFDSALVQNSTPLVAEWMSESPNRTSATWRDLPHMQALERSVENHTIFSAMGDAFIGSIKANKYGRLVAPMYEQALDTTAGSAFASGIASTAAGLARGPGLLVDVARQSQYGQMVAPVAKALSDATGFPSTQEQVEWWLNNPLAKHLDQVAAKYKVQDQTGDIVELVKNKQYQRAAEVAAIQVVANLPQQALTVALTLMGQPGLALTQMGLGVGAQHLKEMRDAGNADAAALSDAILHGSAEAAFERLVTIPFVKKWADALTDKFSKGTAEEIVKSVAKVITSAFVQESLEEGATEVTQQLASQLTGTTKAPLDFTEWQRIAQASVNAMIVGGLSGGLTSSVGAIGAGAARASEKQSIAWEGMHIELKNAERAKNFYNSLGSTIEAMEIRQTLPQTQKNIVEKITKDSTVEKLYISVAAIDKLFAVDNPVKVMNDLGVIKEYEEAKVTGGDVAIPLATWVDKFVGTPAYQALANDVKFSPTDRSSNDIKDQQAAIQAEADKPAQEPDTAAVAASRIKDQLVAIGMNEQEAQDNSVVFEGWLRALGRESGQSPEQLMQMYPLFVKRAAPIPQESLAITEPEEHVKKFEQGKLIDASGIFNKAREAAGKEAIEPGEVPKAGSGYRVIEQSSGADVNRKFALFNASDEAIGFFKTEAEAKKRLKEIQKTGVEPTSAQKFGARFDEEKHPEAAVEIAKAQDPAKPAYVPTTNLGDLTWIPNFEAQPTGVIGEPRILKSFDKKQAPDQLPWSDRKYGVTKQLIRKHKEQGKPLTINTSSDLIAGDDYIAELPENTIVNMYLLTDNEHINRILFPANPSRLRQTQAVDRLREKGIRVNAIEPTYDEVVKAVGGKAKIEKSLGKDGLKAIEDSIPKEDVTIEPVEERIKQAENTVAFMKWATAKYGEDWVDKSDSEIAELQKEFAKSQRPGLSIVRGEGIPSKRTLEASFMKWASDKYGDKWLDMSDAEVLKLQAEFEKEQQPIQQTVSSDEKTHALKPGDKAFVFRLREGWLVGPVGDDVIHPDSVYRWLADRGVAATPVPLDKAPKEIRDSISRVSQKDRDPHAFIEVSSDGQLVTVLQSALEPHPESKLDKFPKGIVKPPGEGKSTNYAFTSVTKIESSRYGTPEGNIWLTVATDRDGKVTYGVGNDRIASRDQAAAGGVTLNEKTPAELMADKKPSMLIVGSNSYIRQNVPFYLIQQYDLHLIFRPQSGAHWEVGVVSLSRTDETETPTYLSHTDKDITKAIQGALQRVVIQHQPEEGEAKPKKLATGQARWLQNWVYRQPKIGMKDVLALPTYEEGKTFEQGPVPPDTYPTITLEQIFNPKFKVKSGQQVAYRVGSFLFKDVGNGKIERVTKGPTIFAYETASPGPMTIEQLSSWLARNDKNNTVLKALGIAATDKLILFQAENDSPRGRIEFANEQATIFLPSWSDPSTTPHEMAHYFLEVLGGLSELPEATDKIKERYAKVLKFLSVQSRAEITKEHHEKFAKSFETYLREGTAPSEALREVFERFKAWLKTVYKSVAPETLTPEIKEFFDTLLAGDKEVQAALAKQEMLPMFDDFKQAGMTDATAEDFATTVKEVQAASSEEITKAAIADSDKKKSQQYATERELVHAQVDEEVSSQPVYIALSVLQRGVFPDGAELPIELADLKLDRTALQEEFPGQMKSLPKPFVYAKENGVHPDDAAERLGFKSGAQLVTALVEAEDKDALVNRLTDERMQQEFPTLLERGTLPLEAMKAIHNDKQDELYRKELEYLMSEHFATFKKLAQRIAGRPAAPTQLLKDQAREAISQKQVRETNPLLYQRAESKAGKEAMTLYLKGDFAGALEAKTRQRYNHALYRAAVEAREFADKTQEYANHFGKVSTRERIGKAGSDYLEQIEAILERFDFKPTTNVAINKKNSLRDWVDAQHEDGIDVQISDRLLNEAYRKSYKELTNAELIDVRSTLENIEHLARLKNKLLANDKVRSIEEAENMLLSTAEAHHDLKREVLPITPGLKDKFVQGTSKFIAAHTRMEFLFGFLDGGKAHGAFWDLLFKPFVVAENAESELAKKDKEELGKIFAQYTRKERTEWFTRKYFIQETVTDRFDGTITRAGALSVALNWGNEYNRQALMDGYGWNEQQVMKILDLLDEKNVATVNALWKHIDTYWPAARDLQKEMTGVAPAKVQGSRSVIRAGKLDGGYYPIKFDSDRSYRQLQLDEKSALGEQFGHATRAMTRHGHLIERTNTGGKPLLLSLSVLSGHLAQVRHDITHRRAIVDVGRMVNRPKIRDAIIAAAGSQMYRQLNPWLKGIAGDSQPDLSSGYDPFLSLLRTNMTKVNLGLKVTTGMVQVLGYLNTIHVIGPKYATLGLGGLNPVRLKSNWEFVKERSVMMRNRLDNYDRDVRDIVRKESVVTNADMAWFYHIGFMDLALSVPTWLGAYQQAMDGALDNIDKGDERAAAEYADSVVRKTMAAGAAKDLAQVQRGDEVRRLFTAFYSQLNIQFNVMQAAAQDFALTKDISKITSAAIFLWFLPSILDDLIKGRGPDEDEDWLTWLMTKTATYPFQTMVIMRDFVNALERKFTTGRRADYTMSPVIQGVESFINVVGAATKPFKGEDFTRTDVKDAVMATGYATGLPSRQVWMTTEYLYDWMNGNVQPANPAEAAWRALVTGKKKE